MSKRNRDKVAAEAPGGGSPSPEPKTFLARWGTLLAGGVVVIAALGSYHNSFSGPFIFDDQSAITGNPTIKHLASALSPPSFAGATTAGRPVLNLTFALNYALGDMNVRGYHALNLLIHLLAGLALFGLVRRTLLRPVLSGRFGAEAVPLALAVAVIWTVHPIQTEAVTYISQRAESLMGLFYLLTLYCFVRSVDETGERQQARGERSEKETQYPPVIRPLASSLWSLASVFSCLLGMMSKEIMATAPVMVLLYDRTFIAGSFREAGRLRWRYYLGLACTWLLLARLLTGLGQRSVGFEQGVTWWQYALTSCRSVVLYLKLAVWPHPLVFDYGTRMIQQTTEAVPYALVLVALLATVLMTMRYRPVIGFAGAWFFVILAPTSSVVPVALQPMAEHRIYLSLAAVAAMGVLGLYAWLGRRSLPVFVAAAMGLGWLSVQRNHDYKSELAIWSDTVAKCPDSERAHNNLGNILLKIPGRRPDAMAQFEAALRINPGSAEPHNNLGSALLDMPGRLPDAIAEFETALRLNPDYAEAHYNLGGALLKVPERLNDAMAQFEAALRIKPDYAEGHNALGNALSRIPGREPDAIAEFETALRINPGYAAAHNSLGNALCDLPGRLPDAMAQYELALRINPDYAEAHNNLGIALLNLPGRVPDAMAEFEAALRINPGYAEAHNNLGNVLLNTPGRVPDAIAQYEAALRIDPGSVETHVNLGTALLKVPGRVPDAIAQFQAALQLQPDLESAREMLDRLQNPNGLQGAGPRDDSLHASGVH